MKLLLPSAALVLASLSLPASAMVVAGASGGGNNANNTTQAQFQSEFGISFLNFGNVVSYSDASGLYLGYNASTKDVWVLTARHISSSNTQGSTITIDGLVYDRKPDGTDGFGLLPGGDLRLVRYGRSDLAVPTLPAVNLSTTVPTASTTLVMIGFGQNRTENATTNRFFQDSTSVTVGSGYHWSGTNVERWGTNQIEAEFLDALETVPVSGVTGTFSLGPYSTIGYMTDFDQPGSGQWFSSNEAQGSLGDSGGSAFYYSGGKWYLSGIMSSVAPFNGQASNTSAFGNLSLLTDVASYSGAIGTSLSGVTLIPEPTGLGLLMVSVLTMLTRRGRTRG